LLIGEGHRSAVGTLVERTSRYLMLLHLPDGREAEKVNTAMTKAIMQLRPSGGPSLGIRAERCRLALTG
jgi:transposase, IS30 family